MNLEYIHLLPQHFSDRSRVWIYQSNRILSLNEALELETVLVNFVEQWKSHGTPVKGFATLFFGQFIILIADETTAQVSGCSTDGSVRMIKSIEEQFKISLFDRTSLAFLIKEKVQLLPLSQLEYALNNGYITADTLFFDNTITHLSALKQRWIVPVSVSWIAKRYPLGSH